MRQLVSGLIGLYQWVFRPIMPPACRYTPSCSQYAREAVLKHGLLRGSWLTVRRVLRCNPWFPGGHDPIP